jgi:hypothetical protein
MKSKVEGKFPVTDGEKTESRLVILYSTNVTELNKLGVHYPYKNKSFGNDLKANVPNIIIECRKMLYDGYMNEEHKYPTVEFVGPFSDDSYGLTLALCDYLLYNKIDNIKIAGTGSITPTTGRITVDWKKLNAKINVAIEHYSDEYDFFFYPRDYPEDIDKSILKDIEKTVNDYKNDHSERKMALVGVHRIEEAVNIVSNEASLRRNQVSGSFQISSYSPSWLNYIKKNLVIGGIAAAITISIIFSWYHYEFDQNPTLKRGGVQPQNPVTMNPDDSLDQDPPGKKETAQIETEEPNGDSIERSLPSVVSTKVKLLEERKEEDKAPTNIQTGKISRESLTIVPEVPELILREEWKSYLKENDWPNADRNFNDIIIDEDNFRIAVATTEIYDQSGDIYAIEKLKRTAYEEAELAALSLLSRWLGETITIVNGNVSSESNNFVKGYRRIWQIEVKGKYYNEVAVGIELRPKETEKLFVQKVGDPSRLQGKLDEGAKIKQTLPSTSLNNRRENDSDKQPTTVKSILADKEQSEGIVNSFNIPDIGKEITRSLLNDMEVSHLAIDQLLRSPSCAIIENSKIKIAYTYSDGFAIGATDNKVYYFMPLDNRWPPLSGNMVSKDKNGETVAMKVKLNQCR